MLTPGADVAEPTEGVASAGVVAHPASRNRGRWTLARVVQLCPVAAALSYPYLLGAFHALALNGGPVGGVMAFATLAAAFGVPFLGLHVAYRLGGIDRRSAFEARARRLAFVSMAAPPMFVLFGVGLGLLGTPIRDVTAWWIFWTLAGLSGALAGDHPAAGASGAPSGLRVFHGVTAALLVLFVSFHLSNHLAGLLGPAAHARVMGLGRAVYRSGAVEPVLLALLLLQLLTGGRLAWNWTRSGGGLHRTIQIGSGVYVGAFVVTHLNSALLSARLVRHVPTDWAWASGAPEGLLYDAWNVRLLPHYSLGVLFLLVHLCSGLRVVLLARGASPRAVGRFWAGGVACSALVAATIAAALLGARV